MESVAGRASGGATYVLFYASFRRGTAGNSDFDRPVFSCCI